MEQQRNIIINQANLNLLRAGGQKVCVPQFGLKPPTPPHPDRVNIFFFSFFEYNEYVCFIIQFLMLITSVTS